MKRPATKPDPIDGPAMLKEGHVQDRHLDKVGDRKGFRTMDGLDWLKERRGVNGPQVEAGRRLQKDYEASQMRFDARAELVRTSGGGRGLDIPDSAIDASRRVNAALAILPPELVTMTALFLLPDFSDEPLSMDRIAARVREDKRAIPLGIRAALSLLARHYG